MKHVCQFIIFKLAVAAFLFVTFATPATAQKAVPQAKPNVDLVICLDTSGSMNGLIESAKTKLWDIVNGLGKADPSPNLRIALFTYGSPEFGQENGWVRKNLDFTTDLDMVYQKLFALRTNGGNEYVARVSKAALDQLNWSKEKNSLRMIFVCGNESATQDPLHKLSDVAQQAVKRDIIINTIYCKWNRATEAEMKSWRELAALSEGRYVQIDQNRGAVAIATPQDKRLAELGGKLNKTYLWYGQFGRARQLNQLAQDANAAKLGASVEAARNASKASTFYSMAGACLVDRSIADPKFDITKIAEKDLPENLKKMKPAERVKHINDLKSKRLALQKEIGDLNKQREQYIREHRQKNQSQTERAFDDAIQGVLRTQAQRKGITIKK